MVQLRRLGMGCVASFGVIVSACGGAVSSNHDEDPTFGKGGNTSFGGGSTTIGSTAVGARTGVESGSIAGGSIGKGTTSIAGGNTGKGGATNSGGIVATGGSTSTGGTASVGGTTAKGGTASVGGTTAKGGSTNSSSGGRANAAGSGAAAGTVSRGGNAGNGGIAGSPQTTGGTLSVPTAGAAGATGRGPEWADVTLYLVRDINAAANSQCVMGTDKWLAQLDSLIYQVRQCQVDDDCMFASFSDECASLCPLPLNKYRVGELGNKLYAIADTACATCPVSALPACVAPPATRCSGGICSFVH